MAHERGYFFGTYSLNFCLLLLGVIAILGLVFGGIAFGRGSGSSDGEMQSLVANLNDARNERSFNNQMSIVSHFMRACNATFSRGPYVTPITHEQLCQCFEDFPPGPPGGQTLGSLHGCICASLKTGCALNQPPPGCILQAGCVANSP